MSDDSTEQPKVPVFRISAANATLLCAGYFLVGAVVELIRRMWNFRWAERLSWSMEAFPAGVLRSLGLLDWIRAAYADGRLEQTHVRLIYATAVVVVVYGIAMLVGALMWGLTRLPGRGRKPG